MELKEPTSPSQSWVPDTELGRIWETLTISAVIQGLNENAWQGQANLVVLCGEQSMNWAHFIHCPGSSLTPRSSTAW